jgi:hypothetical protein
MGNQTYAKLRQFVRLWTKLQPVHHRATHHKLAVRITRGIRFIHGTIILGHGCSSVHTRETNNQISLRKLVSPTPCSSVTASRHRAAVPIRRAAASISRCSPQRARHRHHPPRRGGILHARYAASALLRHLAFQLQAPCACSATIAALLSPVVYCRAPSFTATRRVGGRWPGPCQVQEQLAAARPCHHPRLPAG